MAIEDVDPFDTGFPPVVGDKPEILILGSIPGKKSIEEQEYYGHPRNAFWWVMSEVFGFASDLAYGDRLDALKNHKVALWDVVHRCQRPGSLDSSIVLDSVAANPILKLFEDNPSIRLIAFNGQAAVKLYRQHIEKTISLPHHLLPSTSPAHASLDRTAKLDQWRKIVEPS